MTLQPQLSRTEGLSPFNQGFAYRLPDQSDEVTSGNGNVGYGNGGAQLTAGSTSGDTARLDAPNHTEQDSGVFKRLIWYCGNGSGAPGSFTDDCEIGACTSDLTDTSRKLTIDLANGEYKVGSTTQAWGISNNENYAGGFVEIKCDRGNSETTFFHSLGANSEKVTIANESRPAKTLAKINSNGSGDAVEILAEVTIIERVKI